jgi:hypothetical protein
VSHRTRTGAKQLLASRRGLEKFEYIRSDGYENCTESVRFKSSTAHSESSNEDGSEATACFA